MQLSSLANTILLQACLNAPSPTSENANGLDETAVGDSPPEDPAVHQQQQQQPHQQHQQQQVPGKSITFAIQAS